MEKTAKKKTPNKDSRLYGHVWGATIIIILRLVVGAVFVFSGFTKAIDPWGSIYKFDEYLNSFGLFDYNGLLSFMAFSVSAIEFALGIFLLIGAYRRFTPIMMLLMMAVMLPLTLYIAITNNVIDCGCFGNAYTLSNWGTFWKNVALTLAIIYLVLYNYKVKNIYGFAVQWIVALLAFAYILIIAWVGYYFQPFIDFRPFPVGTVISPQSEYGETEENFLFIYEKGGIRQHFKLDSLPDESWTFVDRILDVPTSTSNNGTVTFHPITVFDEDYDIVEDAITDHGEQLLLLFPSLNDVVIPFTYLINETYDFCDKHGIDVIGLTSDCKHEIEEWNDISMAAYPMYIIDDSELKMIARGNPAAVFLRDGTIVWKQTLQSISINRLSEAENFDNITGNISPSDHLYFLTSTYIAAMLLVLIVNRTHIVVKFSLRRVRKSQKKPVNLQREENDPENN